MQKSKIIEFESLGTHWWITILDKADYSISLEEKLIKTARVFETRYTRFQDSSLVGMLNKNKNLQKPSSEFRRILTASLEYFDSTEGIFNITVGSELEKIGYGVGIDHRSKVSEDPKKDILITEDEVRISNTTRIDLGGIGKGWLIDKLSGYLRNNIKRGFIVNGGGDMYIEANEPISIALEHPFNPEEFIGTVDVNGGFASSSTVKRSWRQNNIKRNHIVNTHHNEAEFVASYIKAQSCVDADVMATVLLLASKDLRDILTLRYKLQYLLLRPDLSYISSENFGARLF